MSEIMLNVLDATRALHQTTHASRVDYVVAALSADPETIEELQAALARFLPADQVRDFFTPAHVGTRAESWDAGVCIIDLTARLVVVQSTYSEPGRRGGVTILDKQRDREVEVPYSVAAEWLFTYQLEGWQALAEERRRTRQANPPLDTRAVLYNKVCDFIVDACWHEAAEVSPAIQDREAAHDAISAIHARWLLTERADLGGRAPRDLLLAQEGHLSRDLQDRANQWSFVGACPPGLSQDAAAYRFGGFGTHEIVMYYEMVRFLLWDCWERRQSPDRAAGRGADAIAAEIRRLESVRDEWLETPDWVDLPGRTPASVIARERARLPEGVSGAEAMIDCDCPLCQMLADDPSPTFWHLDGCNMDDDFAFSFHATRTEWEAERREWEEFDRRWEEEQHSKKAAPDAPVWNRSFVDAAAAGGSPALMLFGLGAHLAELTQDLKDAGADHHWIDEINRAFGNLREVVQDPGGALVDPVIERMCATLDAIAETVPAVADKCSDLERQLTGLTGRAADELYGDNDLPF